VHTGDFTSVGVLTELERHAPVSAVQGNMDDAGLRAALPMRAEVELEGLRLGIVHDAGPSAGRHERLLEAFPSCDVIVYGHTHMPEVARAGEAWILNPGSPTERRRAADHTMIVIADGEPRLVAVA
jgi:putative phosphoesterase